LYAAITFDQYYTPLLCTFGAIGNSLSILVFCVHNSHRNLSSSYYLSALALSDNGYLLNLFAMWLNGLGIRVITWELSCPLVMYLGQVTCFLSVWLTVAFTVERFYAVCHPLKRATICTVSRAKKVIGTITVVALVSFSYVWIIAQVIVYHPVSFTQPLQNELCSNYSGSSECVQMLHNHNNRNDNGTLNVTSEFNPNGAGKRCKQLQCMCI